MTAMMDESGAAVLTTRMQMAMVAWYPHFVVNQNFNMANENTILTSVLQSYPLGNNHEKHTQCINASALAEGRSPSPVNCHWTIGPLITSLHPLDSGYVIDSCPWTFCPLITCFHPPMA